MLHPGLPSRHPWKRARSGCPAKEEGHPPHPSQHPSFPGVRRQELAGGGAGEEVCLQPLLPWAACWGSTFSTCRWQSLCRSPPSHFPPPREREQLGKAEQSQGSIGAPGPPPGREVTHVPGFPNARQILLFAAASPLMTPARALPLPAVRPQRLTVTCPPSVPMTPPPFISAPFGFRLLHEGCLLRVSQARWEEVLEVGVALRMPSDALGSPSTHTHPRLLRPEVLGQGWPRRGHSFWEKRGQLGRREGWVSLQVVLHLWPKWSLECQL